MKLFVKAAGSCAALLIAFVVGFAASGDQPERLFFPTQAAEKKAKALYVSWYRKHLLAAGEPEIYQSGHQGTLRLIVLPTFENPVLIRLYSAADGDQLIVKRLSGAGGYEPGQLAMRSERRLTDAEAKAFRAAVEKSKALESRSTFDDGRGCLDGTSYVFEGGEKRYRLVTRHQCEMDQAFESLVVSWFELSGLGQLPRNWRRPPDRT